jgi:hypothetical protein
LDSPSGRNGTRLATNTEIGLIVDQDILGGSTPPGTRYRIGEFGENSSTGAEYERSSVIVA